VHHCKADSTRALKTRRLRPPTKRVATPTEFSNEEIYKNSRSNLDERFKRALPNPSYLCCFITLYKPYFNRLHFHINWLQTRPTRCLDWERLCGLSGGLLWLFPRGWTRCRTMTARRLQLLPRFRMSCVLHQQSFTLLWWNKLQQCNKNGGLAYIIVFPITPFIFSVVCSYKNYPVVY